MNPFDEITNAGMIEDTDDYPEVVADRKDLNVIHQNNVTENTLDDYKFIRTNLKQVIETNVNCLPSLAKVAQTSQSPRAYEVLGQFLKQMVEANSALMDLHKTTKDILIVSENQTPQEQTINNYFTGSTEELLELIESTD